MCVVWSILGTPCLRMTTMCRLGVETQGRQISRESTTQELQWSSVGTAEQARTSACCGSWSARCLLKIKPPSQTIYSVSISQFQISHRSCLLVKHLLVRSQHPDLPLIQFPTLAFLQANFLCFFFPAPNPSYQTPYMLGFFYMLEPNLFAQHHVCTHLPPPSSITRTRQPMLLPTRIVMRPPLSCQTQTNKHTHQMISSDPCP